MLHRLLLLSVLATASPVVLASSTQAEVDARQPFAQQHERIERDLAGGKVYSELSAADRSQVRQALDRMSQALGDGDIQSMSQERRVAVFNDQELVNGLLTRAREDSRLVCRREKTVGSNLPVSVCHTVAERRRQSDDSRDHLVRAQAGQLIRNNKDP